MLLTGHCLCGQARYHADVEPLGTAICHCKNCQRQTGSAFSILIVVPVDGLEREGEWTFYDDTGDSGAIVRREFCPKCGSPLASTVVDSPKYTAIKAGTLDDVSVLQPQMHLWTKSAQSWVTLDESLPQFLEQPAGV
jgi:hypothetical protein